jgi:hypothetical protein
MALLPGRRGALRLAVIAVNSGRRSAHPAGGGILRAYRCQTTPRRIVNGKTQLCGVKWQRDLAKKQKREKLKKAPPGDPPAADGDADARRHEGRR